MTGRDEAAEEAATLDAGSEMMLENRINDLLAVGQHARARRLAEDFLTHEPESPVGHFLISQICEDSDQYQAGLAAAEEAVRLAPDWANAHMRRATMLFRLGRFAEAEITIRTALAITPDDTNALFNYAQMLNTCDRQEALPLVERALELDPEMPIAHTLRAELLAWINPEQWHIPVEAARRAVQLDPEDPHAHTILGHIQLAAGKAREAEERFRAALRLDPHDRMALQGLTRVLMTENILYRPMLWYSVILQRFGTAGQFAVVIGLWVIVSAAVALMRSWYFPANMINLLLGGYLAFCLYTWFADRVMLWLLKRRYHWLVEVCDV